MALDDARVPEQLRPGSAASSAAALVIRYLCGSAAPAAGTPREAGRDLLRTMELPRAEPALHGGGARVRVPSSGKCR